MAKKTPSLEAVSKEMNKAIEKFMKKIPAAQKKLLRELEAEVSRLDTDRDGRIKPTIKNLSRLSAIQSRLQGLLITPEYKTMISEFASSFVTVTKLTREYFKSADKKFKEKSVLKEIRKQAVADTVQKLTQTGIAATVKDQITQVLRSNITAGGKSSGLVKQFRELLTDTQKGDGVIQRYARQIVTDSVNQYSAQYNQVVFSDLKSEWFSYDGTDIKTTRPFCDAMTDKRYFHITEVPDLLKAEGLYYTNRKTKKKTKVPLNVKTGLPDGMIPETNADNFFINRGGYNCRHMIRPVPVRLVPQAVRTAIEATAAFKNFQKLRGK